VSGAFATVGGDARRRTGGAALGRRIFHGRWPLGLKAPWTTVTDDGMLVTSLPWSSLPQAATPSWTRGVQCQPIQTTPAKLLPCGLMINFAAGSFQKKKNCCW